MHYKGERNLKVSDANYKEIYNTMYAKSPIYQGKMDEATGRHLKDSIVFESVARHNPKSLVDAGCGQGYYVRKFRDCGINAYGVEVSSVCCDTYLQDVPHFNEGLDTHFSNEVNVDFLFCSDVLEHLSYSDLDSVLPKLKKASPIALFGIANHSDIIEGIQLHLIREDSVWWSDKLSLHYANVNVLGHLCNNKFFFIECSV
jgi:2-polyprenyl-3-methyl-5-hydroxy-6-metoxy-1,4-benzoquinol methylase